MALAGVLCMFGLEQWGQATTTFFAQHHTATNFLIGGMLLLALVIQSGRKGFAIFSGYPAIGWLTLALFLYACLSTQWAPRPDISAKLWATRWPYIVTMLMLAPLLITKTQDLRPVYTGVFLAGGILSLLLLFFVKWEARRIVLTESLGEEGLGNPLTVAAIAGMVVLIVILADPWPRLKFWSPFKWALVCMCLLLIIKSGSRGQLLGVLLVSVACWPISRGLKNVKQFALLSFVILFLGISSMVAIQELSGEQIYGQRGRWDEQAAQQDVSGRLNNAFFLVRLAYSSLDTILFGLGNSASYDQRILGIYPHFIPFEILAEEGLVGFLLYLIIYYSVIRSVLRSFRIVSNDPKERLHLGALVGLYVFTSILSLKQGSLLLNLEPFMLGIVLGRYEHALGNRRTENAFERECEDGELFPLPGRSVIPSGSGM
ncbi:MAG: hypothetical protein QM771_05670 [Nitrospira sp.]